MQLGEDCIQIKQALPRLAVDLLKYPGINLSIALLGARAQEAATDDQQRIPFLLLYTQLH
jgi:hypothetical protein